MKLDFYRLWQKEGYVEGSSAASQSGGRTAEQEVDLYLTERLSTSSSISYWQVR